VVAARRTTGHRSSNEAHPEGMTEILILAPIFRVQSQVSTQTGGAPLTTGDLLKPLRDESQRPQRKLERRRKLPYRLTHLISRGDKRKAPVGGATGLRVLANQAYPSNQLELLRLTQKRLRILQRHLVDQAHRVASAGHFDAGFRNSQRITTAPVAGGVHPDAF
jgi:hypothetical protein